MSAGSFKSFFQLEPMPPAYPKPQLPIKEGIPSSAVPDVNALPLEKCENLF